METIAPHESKIDKLRERLTDRHKHDGSLVKSIAVTSNAEVITIDAEFVDESTISADLDPSLRDRHLYGTAKAVIDLGVKEAISAEVNRIAAEEARYARLKGACGACGGIDPDCAACEASRAD